MSKKLWVLTLFCVSFTMFSGGWIALHLFYLAIYGSVIIAEPNRVIAISELVFTVAFIVMAIYTWFGLVKLGRRII